ncbi:MAG: DUF2203 domain-containing protein [Anaerolineae bacterium]
MEGSGRNPSGGAETAKHFTPEEANATLPQLKPLVGELLSYREQIIAARTELGPVLESAEFNGGSQRSSEVVELFGRTERCVQRIHALGCVLKDINQGLVDFPSHREGRQVFLCWKHGEERVGFWHDAESGFAGRQPL